MLLKEKTIETLADINISSCDFDQMPSGVS